MDIAQTTEIIISEAVRDAMGIRGISEVDIRRAMERPTMTERITEVDRVCEGSPEPGRILLVQYKELSDKKVAVLHVYEK